MINRSKAIFIRHKELAVYTTLNYLDKLIAFCLPLAVLYLTKDQQAYNDIEYIFSIASIAVVFLEVGMRTYYFYGYSIASNRELFVEQVKGYFSTLFSFYFLAGIAILPLFYFFNDKFLYLFLFIVIRSLFLFFTGFYNNYFRLIDKPSSIFWYTIPVNLLAIVLIALITITKTGHPLFAFFIPQGILIFLGIYWFRSNNTVSKINELLLYLKTALSYSWPIILNVLLIAYINNYAKIYAYNKMSPEDMFQLSYILRISLIIQMMHISISGYYSKRIFIDSSPGINRKILAFYSGFLALSVLMVFTFLLIINQVSEITKIEINGTTLIIILYTLIWCFLAYLELYMSKFKKPKMILLFSIVATLFYIYFLFAGGVKNVYTISLIMLGSVTINFLLTALYLKFKLFKK